jgi:hypothetical protein
MVTWSTEKFLSAVLSFEITTGAGTSQVPPNAQEDDRVFEGVAR